MSGENDDESREHEPSQRKLDEARKRGEVVMSADLLTAAGYGGLLLTGLVLGGAAMSAAGSAGMVLLDQSDRLAPLFLSGGRAAASGQIGALFLPILPFFILPGAAALLALLAQRALVFAPSKLVPKLSRLDPLATAKQKFGKDGMFAFAKSAAKLLAVSLLLGLFLMRRADDLMSSLWLEPGQIAGAMASLLLEFLALSTLVSLCFGAVDYFWQYLSHRRRNMMSRKELTDEMKDSEGDPHVKSRRRQRAQEVALNRMLKDVATADVVIVNPTHYAVALKWKRGDRSAPICVAKGVDEVAARIRERAATAGVPVHRDPPTARAVYATVELGSPIRQEHFRAVAAAIRFAEAMRKRAKAAGR